MSLRHVSRQSEQSKLPSEVYEFSIATNLATITGYYLPRSFNICIVVRELLMNKIVIIGSCGAGKSTLARNLDSNLDMKVFHLDRIFWQRGWIQKSMDTRIDILQGFVREKRWIIEGNYLSSSELHLEMADTIIFLDITPLVCLVRILKRNLAYRRRSRRDIPEGCTDKLTLRRVWKVLTFTFHGRRTIKQKLRIYQSKQIFWLRSPKEVEDFLAQLEPHVDEKRQFSKPPSVAGKR
jgi:adenylate kinase family enzyme